VCVGVKVYSFPLGEKIIGLALIDRQLYVLRERSCEEIDVYSTVNCRLLRRINISDLNRDSSVTWPKTHSYLDMVSCPVKKCLYLTSNIPYRSSIQRIDLLGNISQSDIFDFMAYGISVERNCNLLLSGYRSSGPVKYATNHREKKSHAIVEWDWKASKIIRDIRLALECDNFLCHPLHSSNYHAVVHSSHGVGLVDIRQGDTGDRGLSFYRSYGRGCGSSVGQLNKPCHMAEDRDKGVIFVADSENGRVVLLSRSLVFIHNITDGMKDHHVRRVCFDSATRRLYVGVESKEGGVLKVLIFRSGGCQQ